MRQISRHFSADVIVGRIASLARHRGCSVAVAGAIALQVVVLLGRSVGQVSVGGGLLLRAAGYLQEAGHLEATLVRGLVELVEEEQEHDGVHADPPDEGAWVVAVDEEQLEGVDHDGDELEHLQRGQVLLPPEEALELGSHGGEQVVRVHDDVHEGVEQAEEGAVAAGGELDAEPHRHRHAAVVDHVQGGHLAGLLSQNEEHLREGNDIG